jgi:DNA repair exonuclease SbcCD ATPase subunit
VMETRKALDELRSRPENRAVELAVRMFLGFLFGGLLVLKLFEPSSVRLYFSEVLQQEYQRYLLGVFDSRLPTTEMSTKAQGRMSPQRFFAALVPVLTIERQEERQRAEDLAKATIRDSFDTIERLRQEACQDHDKQRLNVTELTAQVDNAVTSSRELETAMAAIRDDIEFFQLELERLDAADRQTDERSRFEYASYLSKRLKDARVALRKLEQTHPAETEKQRRLRSALDLAQRGLSEAERQVSKHERRARGLRVVIANEADRRVRATVN